VVLLRALWQGGSGRLDVRLVPDDGHGDDLVLEDGVVHLVEDVVELRNSNKNGAPYAVSEQ
jgi:hypothetical protein